MVKHGPLGLFTTAMAVAALLAGLAGTAEAQRYGGSKKYDSRQSERGDKPGVFDYYTLVLSWSPSHCASLPTSKTRNDPQCSAKPGGRPYAFVLHGVVAAIHVRLPGALLDGLQAVRSKAGDQWHARYHAVDGSHHPRIQEARHLLGVAA